MFTQFFNWFFGFVYHNLIPIVCIVALIQLVIILMIRPDKQFYCHIDGCSDAFDSMEQLISHLVTDHNYSINEETINNNMKEDKN